MSDIDDAYKARVVEAAEAFAHTMRVPGTGTLAEWEDQQKAALNALLDIVDDHLDAKEAEHATDS